MASRVSICAFVVVFCSVIVSSFGEDISDAESKEFVLTLDHSNFTETVSKHNFIVIEFYAPWCGHCKNLAPEYEKAASVLSSNDPPVVLAKVDASDEQNKPLAAEFEVTGFPTLVILRNGGKNGQEYKGPRDADGIVSYLKKQSGPASAEIKSAEDASSLIDGNKIVIVGVFPEFSGEKFENFTALAEHLRSDYAFGHTLDAKILPRGQSSLSGPIIRLFKPFDELFVDFQDFDVDALEKSVEEATVPVVTIFDTDESNHPFVVKFFEHPTNAKAMLFLDFSGDHFDAFKSKYHEVAEKYKGKGISFLMGDLEASQRAFEYYGVKDTQAPLIIIQSNDGQKYLKPNIEYDQIVSWVKDYQEGNVLPYVKSEPIPENNSDPVKVVVADSLQDIVFKSGKNVLLEFYAPWCGHCKQLAPILDEVAVSLQSDEDVIIAKIDATANDVPNETFDVKGFPTLYFKSASGNLSQYDGDRTKEAIIEFIQNSRDKIPTEDSRKDDSGKGYEKDEL